MHHTLRGLTLQLKTPLPLFAGGLAVLQLSLVNARRTPRHAIGLALLRYSVDEPRELVLRAIDDEVFLLNELHQLTVSANLDTEQPNQLDVILQVHYASIVVTTSPL